MRTSTSSIPFWTASVADGLNRVLPLMPEFVQPQHDPAAGQPDLTEQQRKQDCERNAAQRRLDSNMPALLPCRPVLPGDGPLCCQPLCQRVLDSGADFLFVCKPNSHKTLYKVLPDRRIRSTGWIRTRIRKGRIDARRIRWRNNVQVRAGKGALRGNRIEIETRHNGRRTCRNAFFTSLRLTAANVAGIARAGRARWTIENEAFNCLSRQGYNLRHSFGHGRHGLANVLATLNLFAFTLHSVLDCLSDLWRQCRDKAGAWRNFFEQLRFLAGRVLFPDWTALLETMLGRRQLVAVPT